MTTLVQLAALASEMDEAVNEARDAVRLAQRAFVNADERETPRALEELRRARSVCAEAEAARHQAYVEYRLAMRGAA